MKDISNFVHGFMKEYGTKTEELATNMSMQEFSEFLIKEGMFKDEKSIKMFLIDIGLRSLNQQDFDLPISYYSVEEDCCGIVDTGDVCLTDSNIDAGVIGRILGN